MDMSFRGGPEHRSLSTSTGEPELFAHGIYKQLNTRGIICLLVIGTQMSMCKHHQVVCDTKKLLVLREAIPLV